jgi:peptidoglycan/LPS O-acetylase OafA/YrhL
MQESASREGLRDGLLGRFARRTSGGRYIPQVDGLRFVAIASVFVFHTQLRLHEAFGGPMGTRPRVHDPLGALVSQGRLGVHVFFVISGFVLGLPFASQRLAAGRPVSLRRYFLRRLTRIEPPYLVALTLFFLIAATTTWWGTGAGPVDLATGVVYGHGLVLGTHNPIDPPFWTLEIEVQFYVLAPVLALLFAISLRERRRLVIALVAMGVTAVQGGLATPAIAVLSGTILNVLQFFLVGFLLADIYIVDWRGDPTTNGMWDWVSIVGWPLFFAGGLLGVQVIHVALPWIALLLFIAAFRGRRTSRALGSPWVRTIGGMCYSIYLIHTPLLWMLTHQTASIAFDAPSTANVAFQAVLLAPVVLMASAAFFLLIEKPCMDPDWLARLVGRFRRTDFEQEVVIDLTPFEVEEIPR